MALKTSLIKDYPVLAITSTEKRMAKILYRTICYDFVFATCFFSHWPMLGDVLFADKKNLWFASCKKKNIKTTPIKDTAQATEAAKEFRVARKICDPNMWTSFLSLRTTHLDSMIGQLFLWMLHRWVFFATGTHGSHRFQRVLWVVVSHPKNDRENHVLWSLRSCCPLCSHWMLALWGRFPRLPRL